ncbi:hypothetical protein [Novipirellula artificiosorum]|uniref:Uncharacterized protein n=1 Tax=Novipirellula artificiosorum TaxID=2528016 RepID=A0A5C6DDW5_9BACT|nr:hypothetical protein [Novipirellula artificiosorum]TWU34990.1 hypothetical protein Poly41_41340 [Novipirellula artificiosorum]
MVELVEVGLKPGTAKPGIVRDHWYLKKKPWVKSGIGICAAKGAIQ